ncbi:class I SAM-dependent methyltransferase [Deinococcus hopiensis]|uniref:Methylase involved in ubiquinone/menaquinone biosynthesis n=1 Tax=Deinococcus hopiensis KR-140 TaxID=695939 RepID=A0A1W1U9P2_9DEIO|nr:class I SAM-dependent methyltransferase [Deinococcus hopiensis]SMB77760.1 Methylase involved in ubiquinone/menaquinone biosynthesis [Deinococcus hopiensis KR-140]
MTTLIDAPHTPSFDLRSLILAAGETFVERAYALEKDAKRTGQGIPSLGMREAVAAAYWQMINEVERLVVGAAANQHREEQRALLALTAPVLLRSEYFARSYLKPQGYAGDYRMMEMMYDLEHQPGEDPYKAPLVNALDYTFSTIHSVRAVWERRRYLRDLIVQEAKERTTPLRVLDIACGGARYIGEAFAALPEGVLSVHLIDQDPSALAYAEGRNLNHWREHVRTQCLPIKTLLTAPLAETYDVVISSGLFDYLDQPTARHLVHTMGRSVNPGGVLAITNFHPEDASAFCKDWLADWPLILRTEAQVAELFEGLAPVILSRSTERSLVFAQSRINV